MPQGGCSRMESSWRSAYQENKRKGTSPVWEGWGAAVSDVVLVHSRGIGSFDSSYSGREHPRDMSSSETRHCYGEIHDGLLGDRSIVRELRHTLMMNYLSKPRGSS
eukprot:gene15307-biopygen4232